MTSNKIPRTTIQRFYQHVCHLSYDDRRGLSEKLIADPGRLVSEFTNGIATFGSYSNDEGFYSNPHRCPTAPEPIKEIKKTCHVAWYLRQQGLLEVSDASDLNARYVDYEIAPTRTTGNAQFDDDNGSWRTGIFIDLLLATCDTSMPIVGELKIRVDKEPFTALIQMLVGAVHLVTAHQYQRVCKFLPAGKFPAAEQPKLDGYILLYRFLKQPQADLEALDRNARELSAILMKHDGITTHIRRIVCLALELESGKLHATCRWRQDAPSAISPPGSDERSNGRP